MQPRRWRPAHPGGVLQGAGRTPSMPRVAATGGAKAEFQADFVICLRSSTSGGRPGFCRRGRWLIRPPPSPTHGHPGDVTKRDFLKLVTGAAAAIGSRRRRLALHRLHEPVEGRAGAVLHRGRPDADRRSGRGITVLWQGKPIFVRHRTDKEIKEAEDVPMSQLIEPQTGSGAGEGRAMTNGSC